MAETKHRVAAPAEPDARTAAALQAKDELAPPPAPPATGTTETPAAAEPAVDFDYHIELENHRDALQAILRLPYVLMDLQGMPWKLARGLFRKADQGSRGLADRWTRQAMHAVEKGEKYDSDRWALYATIGALLKEVLQDAGEEKQIAEEKAARAKAEAAERNEPEPRKEAERAAS